MYTIDRITEVPSDLDVAFNKTINKFKKVATKLDLEPIKCDLLEKNYKKQIEFDGTKFLVTFNKYHIHGAVPVLNGWSVRARIDAGVHSENIIRSVVDVPERFRDNSTFCEHCNTNRKRKKLFLLEHVETGEWVRVGSSCLKQFVDIDEVDSIINNFENLIRFLDVDLNPEVNESYGKSFPEIINLKSFLAMVIHLTKQYGYMSGTKARELDCPSTGDDALYVLTNEHDSNKKIREEVLSNTGLIDQATAIIEYFKTIEPTSDYERVLSILAKDEFLIPRESNYAASMYITYQRIHEQQNASEQKVNEYLDLELKKRYSNMTLNLIKIITCESIYGYSYLHIFEDAEGRCVRWFGSKRLGEPGVYNNLSFTVKGFDEYKGVKQTTITRVSQK